MSYMFLIFRAELRSRKFLLSPSSRVKAQLRFQEDELNLGRFLGDPDVYREGSIHSRLVASLFAKRPALPSTAKRVTSTRSPLRSQSEKRQN